MVMVGEAGGEVASVVNRRDREEAASTLRPVSIERIVLIKVCVLRVLHIRPASVMLSADACTMFQATKLVDNLLVHGG